SRTTSASRASGSSVCRWVVRGGLQELTGVWISGRSRGLPHPALRGHPAGGHPREEDHHHAEGHADRPPHPWRHQHRPPPVSREGGERECCKSSPSSKQDSSYLFNSPLP